MSFMPVKDAVLELLSSDDDTDTILSKVDPAQRDEVLQLLHSVKAQLAKNATLGYAPAGGNGGMPSEPMEMSKEEPRKGAVKDKGFFSSEHLHEVLAKPTHTEAKNYAHSLVDSSGAHEHNKVKARDMINRSKNPRHLAQGMANFMMAHPSEGLGMGANKK
jgi:hypothetical protein